MLRHSRLRTRYSVLCVLSVAFTLATHLSLANAKPNWEKIPSTDFTLNDPPDEVESAREIELLLVYQSQRTKQECLLGEQQSNPNFKSLFGNSQLLTKKEISLVKPLLDRVSNVGERVSSYFKARFKRPRPFNFDSRVVPCVTPPGGAKSYPSTHATVSTLASCVLASIFSSYANDFNDLGLILSERRMKVGVHFPSDVQAGRDLAGAICQRLSEEQDFNDEIEKLRQAL